MDIDERRKKLEERTKYEKERELNDIKKVLERPEGRRLLWRIMSMAETFRATSTDKRIIGLTLFDNIMEIAPDVFLQMRREYVSEQISLQKQFPVEPDELI